MTQPNPDAKLRSVCPELDDVKEKADLQKQLVAVGEFDIDGVPYVGLRKHSFSVSYHTIDIIHARMLELAEENEAWRDWFKGLELVMETKRFDLTPASAEGGRDESHNM